MCGIVGFVSDVENVVYDAIKCLKKLEYRGYDSSGIAVLEGDKKGLRTIKSVGEIKNLEPLIGGVNSNIAISHTRWATHGKPSTLNAHPQSAQNIAVVHNGIIENYLDLKADLEKNGFTFSSQTDTEVITHLVADFLNKGLALHEIGFKLQNTLKGSFAICVLIGGLDSILCLKNHAPLVIGFGRDNEAECGMVASDIYALTAYSDSFYHFEDGEVGVLTSKKIALFSKDFQPKTPSFKVYNINDENFSCGSFSSFMQKEIYEQPSVLSKNIQAHLADKQVNFTSVPFELNGFESVVFVACGTSYYASLVASYWMQTLGGVNAQVEIASEFRYRDTIFRPRCLYVFVSQSGETADTLAALKLTSQNLHKTSKTLAIVNVPHSSIASLCDGLIECHSGPEIGVASTKNFSAQLMSLLFLSLKFSTKPISDDLVDDLANLPSKAYELLESGAIKNSILKIANEICKMQKVIYIGRNLLFGIALEGALKLKELSYIPVESVAAGELKHGPLAIVDEDTLVVAFNSSHLMPSKMESNIQEILARSGKIVLVADFLNANLANECTEFVQVPSQKTPFLTPVLLGIIGQLISYHAASIKGLNVDKPRNLAKSVTVE
jgi:glucosamine--fructose-6-phosphate aminotransferase (isomerizing)